MKKFAFVPMVALAFTAACADDPMGPSAVDAASFGMSYEGDTWQAGNGSAFHGYNAPRLSNLGATPCAAWNDNREPATADHYSFEFQRFDGEGWVEAVKLNNADGSVICVGEPLEDGTYRAVAMAKDGKGQTTTTHHTNATAEFVVGGGYSIIAVGGNCKSGFAPNANANTWNLTIQLFLGGVLVEDGRDLFASGDLMSYSSEKHEYHINAKDSAGATLVAWDFAVDGGDVFSSFTCEAPAQNGGGQGQGNGRNR